MSKQPKKPIKRDRLSRYEVIDQPLAELSGPQDIYVHCDDAKCTHGKAFTAEELIELIGPEATARDVASEVQSMREVTFGAKACVKAHSPDK